MVKKVYQEALKYIGQNNIQIQDCLSHNIDLGAFELENCLFFSENDRILYIRLIMINVLIKTNDNSVTNFLISVDSTQKDVLYVLFNLFKKIITFQQLKDTQKLQILKKCKVYWCYKYLRGVLVHIFTKLSDSACYFEILPLDFIIRYSLWTKQTFYLSASNQSEKYNFNVFLVSRFLQTINFMNYKYIRKTMGLLDPEMFDCLPVKYTELGLSNIVSFVKDHKIRLNLPFLDYENKKKYTSHLSLTIRKFVLQDLENPEIFYEILKYSQLTNDEDLIDKLAEKCLKLAGMFSEGLLVSLKKLIENACKSIFPYRRLLGMRLSEAFEYRNLDYQLKLNLIFDNSQAVRRFSKKLIEETNYEDLEAIFIEERYKNVEPIIEHIRDSSKIIKNAADKVERFLEGNSDINIHNHLRLLIETDYFNIEDYILRLRNVKIQNRIVKEICYFYYKNKSTSNLIDILLTSDDLGVILTIDKYLETLKVDFSKIELLDILNRLSSNDKRIRKSAGLGVLFKSLSVYNKELAMNRLLSDVKAHMKCSQAECFYKDNSKRECENILYHSFSIILSLIEEEIISLELLELCFTGLKSDMWIVKNSSIQLFSIIYGRVESIELNEGLRSYIREALKGEIERNNPKSIFNDLIYCLVLITKKYETLNMEESYLLESTKNIGGAFNAIDLIQQDRSSTAKWMYSTEESVIDLQNDLKTYNELKNILLTLVSEDSDYKAEVMAEYFPGLNITQEKIIEELITIIKCRGLVSILLEDLKNVDGSCYDIEYLKFMCIVIKLY
ncbi:hypothetical protein NGRA_0180 [Nosema granulosis]|uniref:DUF2428 domain-containing protein n=1 Tax=Nosema granulosis TaxID=83296 RepID=A0A9P6H1C4_9MICR|nr:hypothetical protein NGRA_0180 [Nosema granulosis]